jgi:copper chaperone CopZ
MKFPAPFSYDPIFEEASMTTLTLKVPSISCGHCVHTIQTELSALPGIQSVSARADTKQVVVTFAPPATPAQIETTLAEINFPVERSN